MKYISLIQLQESLEAIRSINQFFGFTFLAAKKIHLPIGETIQISIDALNQTHLNDYYLVDPRSKFYFRIFKYNNNEHSWLRPDYAGKGLQKLNTTTFKDAFIHETKSKEWGWRENYVQFLKTKLTNNQPISAFHLAVWFFRNRTFEENFSRKKLVSEFYKEFNITQTEKDNLFNSEIISKISEEEAFQNEPISWKSILNDIEAAPDVKPNQGGILSLLELEGIGPVSHLLFEPAERMNIITGDNGLGKTFILEAAWWALTGKWAGQAAYPNNRNLHPAKIKYLISGADKGKPQTIIYSTKENSWPSQQKRSTISGLVVYARVDGSFAIWDPAGKLGSFENDVVVFNKEQVWDGNPRIEGLVRDWTKWQDKPTKYPFDIFQRVIQKMSPPEMEKLTPGQPVRLIGDPREIPTLMHSYGEVPILHESAGIKRIITLAYLIVWVWNEHKILSEQHGQKLEKRMVILIDELEAHLHPKWQRAILPALLDVAKILSSDLELQLIIASHSPLVLASSESVFDTESDKLFHLETGPEGKVSFEQIQYIKYGHVNSWLESDVFNLKEARSHDSQIAIELAIKTQKKTNPTREEIQEVNALLLKNLSTEDKFWNRWIFFAKKHGVQI